MNDDGSTTVLCDHDVNYIANFVRAGYVINAMATLNESVTVGMNFVKMTDTDIRFQYVDMAPTGDLWSYTIDMRLDGSSPVFSQYVKNLD